MNLVDTFGGMGDKPTRRYDNRLECYIRGFCTNQLPQYTPVSESLAARLDGCRRGGCVLWELVIRLKISPKLYSKIIRDERISHGAFRAWHLFRDMTGKNECCWPSLKTICRELHCGRAALLGWIKELKSAGYIKVEKRELKRSNRYFVNGSIQNLRGSTCDPQDGSKQGHELKPVEPKIRNGTSSPGSLIIYWERKLKEAKETKSRILRNCAQDAFGKRYFDAFETIELSAAKATITEAEAQLNTLTHA
jgi:hypothetical protein